MIVEETGARHTYEVKAEENGWRLFANVTVRDNSVENIDGSASKDGHATVIFNGWRNNEKLTRGIHNVTDDTDDVYPVVTEFVDSTIVKYEV